MDLENLCENCGETKVFCLKKKFIGFQVAYFYGKCSSWIIGDKNVIT